MMKTTINLLMAVILFVALVSIEADNTDKKEPDSEPKRSDVLKAFFGEPGPNGWKFDHDHDHRNDERYVKKMKRIFEEMFGQPFPYEDNVWPVARDKMTEVTWETIAKQIGEESSSKPLHSDEGESQKITG